MSKMQIVTVASLLAAIYPVPTNAKPVPPPPVNAPPTGPSCVSTETLNCNVGPETGKFEIGTGRIPEIGKSVTFKYAYYCTKPGAPTLSSIPTNTKSFGIAVISNKNEVGLYKVTGDFIRTDEGKVILIDVEVGPKPDAATLFRIFARANDGYSCRVRWKSL